MAEEQQQVGIGTEPLKTIVFNAPFAGRQKTAVRLTNNSRGSYYWQMKSTKAKCFIPTPTGGVLKSGDQVVVLVSCEPMPAPPSNDRLTLEYVDAPADATRLDRSVFEGAAALNRRVMQIVVNE